MPSLAVRRIKTHVETITVGCQCNQCGREVTWLDEPVPHEEVQNFHEFQAGGGYATTYPCDTDSISFILCSDCLKALCDGFKVPVDYNYGLGGENEPIAVMREDTQQLATINWGWLIDGSGEDVPHKEHPDDFYDHDWPEYRPGAGIVYRHFKGKHYEVVRWVLHFETGEPFVIYSPLYGEARLWARKLSSWNEKLVDGTSRFEKVNLNSMP